MTTEEKKDEAAACGCGTGTCGGANKWIWIVLALAVAAVLMVKESGKRASSCGTETCALPPQAVVVGALPRLVDLGAGECIPCKMMAPILEDLKNAYAGKLEVQFIDVLEDKEAGVKFGVNMIPTQIFYGANGKELFRHEGFYSKEDILAKWKEFGVELVQKSEVGSQKPE
ncbi:MAG: thioredoxin family protein [bacterium]